MQLSVRVFARAAALIVLLSTASVAVGGPPQQWLITVGGNGHWYQFVRLKFSMNGDQAAVVASATGGHLATCTCAAEFAFVRDVLVLPEMIDPEEFGPYLGGRRINDAWVWLTGEEWEYTAWGPDQPNGNEGSPWLHIFRWSMPWWNDTNGFPDHRSYVVEWDDDCNGDGVVDFGQILSGALVDSDGNGVPDCCDDGIPCAAAPVEWPTSAGGNGHWYQFNPASLSWASARDAALSVGGDLATVTTQGESDYLFNVVGSPHEPWLGGFQDPNAPGYSEPAGGWRWVTGEPWSFTIWGINEPDNLGDEGAITFGGPYQGAWNDLNESWLRPSIIEWSADCNADGIVDFGQILSGELADANGNNIPDCCEGAPACNCFGDVTGNGVVDGVDLAAMLGAWGTSGQGQFDCDVNNDGIVDGADLAVLLGDWGACRGSAFALTQSSRRLCWPCQPVSALQASLATVQGSGSLWRWFGRQRGLKDGTTRRS